MEITWQKVAAAVMAIFLLIVLLQVSFGKGALLDRVKNSALGKIAIYTGIIKEDIYITPTKAPDELKKAFDNLYETLKDIPKESENCFIKYNPINVPKGFKIELTYVEKKLYLKLSNPQGLILAIENVTGLEPCVVAGIRDSKKMTKVFYDNYLTGKLKEPLEKPDFSLTRQILLSGDRNIESILLDDKPTKIDDETHTEYLYVPEKNKICFFPTHPRGWKWGCDAGDNSLDSECFTNKLSDLLKNNKQYLCGESK